MTTAVNEVVELTREWDRRVPRDVSRFDRLAPEATASAPNWGWSPAPPLPVDRVRRLDDDEEGRRTIDLWAEPGVLNEAVREVRPVAADPVEVS